MQKQLLVGAAAALLVVAMACSDPPARSTSPTSPTGFASESAAADDATLKASAPTLQSPIGGVRVTVQQPALTIGAATGKFVNAAFQHRIQVTNEAGIVLYDEVLPAGVLSYTVPVNLDNDKTFRWRARAELDNAAGPWSAYETFLSMKQPEGYNRPGELFDPLTNGKTIGTVVGPVEFIAGQGVKLLTHDSYITYTLPETIQEGEFSIMVTGIDEGNPGDKTKVMCMQEDGGDITVNDYRFTVEKRGREYPIPGAVTFRIITGDAAEEDQIHDAARIGISLSDENWYFWKAVWTFTNASVEVREGGLTGPVLYSRGVGYSHPYRPTPHVVHLGAPAGRAGSVNATVPGMIIKNVWVARTPRPAWVDQTPSAQ